MSQKENSCFSLGQEGKTIWSGVWSDRPLGK